LFYSFYLLNIIIYEHDSNFKKRCFLLLNMEIIHSFIKKFLGSYCFDFSLTERGEMGIHYLFLRN